LSAEKVWQECRGGRTGALTGDAPEADDEIVIEALTPVSSTPQKNAPRGREIGLVQWRGAAGASAVVAEGLAPVAR